MTGKNHAISVRSRLLARSRRDGEEFQRILVRYAIERLLYRLSISPHADAFVLKGATLFALWLGKPHRATKDLDLLGRGSPDVGRFVELMREVALVACPEDGVLFDADGVTGARIREDAAYAGVRVIVPGHLAGARLKIQVDVGLGDAMVPAPATVVMPSLLDLPPARLRAYARETVVAEKLEALVVLGLATSRMKDLYDLDLLRKTFDLGAGDLARAVSATFARRGTAIPHDVPVGLSDEFATDPVKTSQWAAFLRRATDSEALELPDVVSRLREWLLPVIERARGIPLPNPSDSAS